MHEAFGLARGDSDLYLLGVQNQLYALLDGLGRSAILCYDLRLLVSSTPHLELVPRRIGSLFFRLSSLQKDNGEKLIEGCTYAQKNYDSRP